VFTVAPISAVSFNITFGKSVTGIGYIGGSRDDRTGTVERLRVHWHDLTPNPLPFSLLSWHTKLSDFSARSTELTELNAWASTDHAILIKFITGEGGVGKSRLAANFAQSLTEGKWAAGFVDLRKPSSFPLEEKGTLLVVDYPEECCQQVEELLSDLVMLSPESKIRVIFLTRRSIDDWLQAIHNSNAANLVDTRPLVLEGMESTSGYEIYSSALEQAADALGTTPPPLSEEQFADWVNLAPENRLPLFIMATAVHSAMSPQDPVVRYTGKEVVKILVDREIHRLRRIAMDREEDDDLVFARLSAMAAVAGGLTVQDVARLAESAGPILGFRSRPNMEAYLRDAVIFQEGYIQAPKPDIPAAAFTTNVLSCSPAIAPSLLWIALATNIEGSLNRIARLSYDSEIMLGLHEHRLSAWLATAIDGDENRCRVIRPFFTEIQLPMGWVDAAVALWRTLLEVAKADYDRADLLNKLSVDLSDSGDNTGALEAIKEAVDIRRRLAEANPARYEPLAISLNNLSAYLSDSGDNTGALEAIQEAVDVYRRLVEANPARYESDLATSLNNLSNCLRAAGDNTGALEAIQEAMEVYRRLAEANPARYESDLAMSLNNLSNRLSVAGDNIGALEAIQEAMEVYRRLAGANPARYEPELARGCGMLGTVLHRIGRDSDAADAFQEGINILRLFEQKYERNAPAELLAALERDLENTRTGKGRRL